MLKRIKKKMRFAGKAGEKATNKCNAGFSLIEVIAVTIIIGVMATMLMPAIDGAGSKARNAKLKNDLATLDQAIATYKLEHRRGRQYCNFKWQCCGGNPGITDFCLRNGWQAFFCTEYFSPDCIRGFPGMKEYWQRCR